LGSLGVALFILSSCTREQRAPVHAGTYETALRLSHLPRPPKRASRSYSNDLA
jgi:hypothetical protein